MRTARWLGDDISNVAEAFALPELSDAEFSIRLRPQAGEPAGDLAGLIRDGLGTPKSSR